MLVREIMTSPAITVRVDAPLDVALQILARRQLTLLPVVDASDELVGVLSEADVLRVSAAPDPRAHLRSGGRPRRESPATVAGLMTRQPHTTTETADVADVARVFADTAWKCLPVLRDGQVVGVISRSDIVWALARPDEEISTDVNELLSGMEPTRWAATVDHGKVEIRGPGSVRDGDAAASLAATVPGVREVHVTPLQADAEPAGDHYLQAGVDEIEQLGDGAGHLSSGSADDQL